MYLVQTIFARFSRAVAELQTGNLRSLRVAAGAVAAVSMIASASCSSGQANIVRYPAGSPPTELSAPASLAEFEPIKDDALAARHAPLLIPSAAYGDPIALYYRASKDRAGHTYLTYHFVWAAEENQAGGCLPMLSRNLYTGGVGLQQSMFGPGDIELVTMRINPRGQIDRLGYETAENYDPSSFGVKHLRINISANPGTELRGPFVFEVISWNHLFALRSELSNAEADPNSVPLRIKTEERDENPVVGVNTMPPLRLQPEYFREELWSHYGMVKVEERFFSRSRAHELHEREAVE